MAQSDSPAVNSDFERDVVASLMQVCFLIEIKLVRRSRLCLNVLDYAGGPFVPIIRRQVEVFKVHRLHFIIRIIVLGGNFVPNVDSGPQAWNQVDDGHDIHVEQRSPFTLEVAFEMLGGVENGWLNS